MTELLIETLTGEEAGIITESVNDGKNMFLNGVFMQSGIKNRNGRNYSLNEITKSVTEANQRITESRGILGELDHPQSLQINLDRVSHVITELKMVGPNAIGKAKIVETPMGTIAKQLVDAGVLLGVSSRGAGNVNESGNVEGFQLITVDIVATPSAPGAVPNSVYESLQINKHGIEAISLAEQVKNDITAQKYLKKEIMKFLNEGLFAKK